MKRYGLVSETGPEGTLRLMNVTLGLEKADLAIVNGTLLNVYTGEFLENHAVTVKGAWIAYVGDQPEENIGPDTEIIDAKGKILIPGLIDGHAHLADFQYRPSEFLRYAMAGGTTTIITETMEPYPIRGYEGIVDFIASLQDQPIMPVNTIRAAQTRRFISSLLLPPVAGDVNQVCRFGATFAPSTQ